MTECEEAFPALADGARTLGLSLDAGIRASFCTYCQLLTEANQNMNLTAIRTPEGMMTTLFLDSLTSILAIPPELRTSDSTAAVIDVGAGAGLPGVPLALAFPEWRLTLVESIGKKARFLEQLVVTLRLSGARVVPERAETVAGQSEFRDGADLCLARAVAPMPTLVELCAPLVRPGGFMVFPKGRDAAGETESAHASASAVGAVWEATVPLPGDLAHLGEGRVLVRYRKLKPTPARFPRRVGLARSQPILVPGAGPTPTHGSQSRQE